VDAGFIVDENDNYEVESANYGTENYNYKTENINYETGSGIGNYETETYSYEKANFGTENDYYEDGSGNYGSEHDYVDAQSGNYETEIVNYEAGKVNFETSSGYYEDGSGYETEIENNEISSGDSESNHLNGKAKFETGKVGNGIRINMSESSKGDLFEREKKVTTYEDDEEKEAKQYGIKVGHYRKGSRHFEIAGGPKETGSQHSETGNESGNKGARESLLSLGTLHETKGEQIEVPCKFILLLVIISFLTVAATDVHRKTFTPHPTSPQNLELI